MVNNVYISAVTQDNISRTELLAWVNDCLQSNFTRIEEMSTGAGYCQLTHFLFPQGISLKKVKMNSRNEVDHINNWKILQTSWKALGVEKPVPVEKLLKAKFQDNFEFLQWFKKFFDANYDGSEYDPIAERGGEPLPAGAKGPAKPAARPAARAPVTAARKPVTAAAPAARVSPATRVAAAPVNKAGGGAEIALIQELKAQKDELEEKYQGAAEAMADLERERDFYFGVLREVEDYCTQREGQETVNRQEILNILYKNQDGAQAETEAEATNGAASDAVAGGAEPAPEEPSAVNGAVQAMQAAALADDDETF